MGGLRSLTLGLEYRTGTGDLVRNFYDPCLRKSTRYDRSVGYFRSSVFTLVGRSLTEFARGGGKMRLVCSPDLTVEDVETMQLGYRSREDLLDRVFTEEITALVRDVSTHDQLVLLSTLIALGILEIKIAFPMSGHGIYHEKMGLFVDSENNMVSFKGSANDSWAAWHRDGNIESFDVFCSWHTGSDSQRVTSHAEYFQRLWDGEVNHVETLPFPTAVTERLSKIACKTLEEIPLPGQENLTIPRTAHLHQITAVNNWKQSGHRGIFEHATGTGKTYTAMLAIREHSQSGLPTLVIVPSSLLFSQWLDEFKTEFPDVPIMRVGDGNQSWRQAGRVESFTGPSPDLGPRVILATAQTASQPEFRLRVAGGNHLMIVGDEVHRLGSPDNSQLFTIATGWRLGLSATPYRYGDREGTDQIFSYFGQIIPPIIKLKDAINSNLLVSYEYFPHTVELTEDESNRWRQLSKDVSKLLVGTAFQNLKDIPDNVKHLLIRRARIAKKAQAKVPLAVDILREHYRNGQSWLVYCEDGEQLRELSRELIESGLSPMHYYTGMTASPSDTIKWFARYGGLLLSIRCLDEGVDIPSVSHALILASSQNPREFIQRRGRVLRRDPTNAEKTVAVIHDALVIPRVEDSSTRRLVKSELARAIEFARNALNSATTIWSSRCVTPATLRPTREPFCDGATSAIRLNGGSEGPKRPRLLAAGTLRDGGRLDPMRRRP